MENDAWVQYCILVKACLLTHTFTKIVGKVTTCYAKSKRNRINYLIFKPEKTLKSIKLPMRCEPEAGILTAVATSIFRHYRIQQ